MDQLLVLLCSCGPALDRMFGAQMKVLNPEFLMVVFLYILGSQLRLSIRYMVIHSKRFF
jgi:hypothetical protein